MTPLDLLDQMKIFVEQETKDLLLPVWTDRRSGKKNERPAEVHKMQLPNKKAELERVPYALIQFLTGKDEQKPGEETESSCKIRIVCATYSEDQSEGSIALLNLMERIRFAFLRDCMIADRYLLKTPLEWIIYPDNNAPYYLGEMITEWTLPPVHMEEYLPGPYLDRRQPIVESEVEEKW